MDDKLIPYIAFESATARQERTIKRLWVICIILIMALLATNGAWLWWESQFEYYEVTQEIDATSDDYSDLNLTAVGGDYGR
jgi:hypothetical protein